MKKTFLLSFILFFSIQLRAQSLSFSAGISQPIFTSTNYSTFKSTPAFNCMLSEMFKISDSTFWEFDFNYSYNTIHLHEHYSDYGSFSGTYDLNGVAYSNYLRLMIQRGREFGKDPSLNFRAGLYWGILCDRLNEIEKKGRPYVYMYGTSYSYETNNINKYAFSLGNIGITASLGKRIVLSDRYELRVSAMCNFNFAHRNYVEPGLYFSVLFPED